MKQIDALNDELATRQESIDLPKGRLKNQITSFKETIAKVLDKDTSLGEKIRILFREQGITIASILTAIGMAIGVLIEALLPGVGIATASGGPPPKDEKGLACEHDSPSRQKRKLLLLSLFFPFLIFPHGPVYRLRKVQKDGLEKNLKRWHHY